MSPTTNYPVLQPVLRLLTACSLVACLALPALSADIAVSGYALSDNGDDDGYADTNEIVNLQITVRNATDAPLTGVTARLETDDPKIECLVQHLVYIGDLAAGMKGKNCRPIGRVMDPKPLTEYDPRHPYIIAMYDVHYAG